MKTIYITFLIGNGFDINLGLKTRYSDFYKFFLEKAHESNMIKKWIEQEDYLWSDLEMRLGEKTKCIEDDSLTQFYEDKIELDRLLIEYLEKEQKRFIISESNSKDIESEFTKSVKNISEGFTIVDDASIKATKDSYRNEVYEYHFITYNYTDVLDRIVELCKKHNVEVGTHLNTSGNKIVDKIGNVFHVHGTITGEAILGVNDKSQIGNDSLKEDETFASIIIKKMANELMGQRRTERAKEILLKSQIVCVFGMSIGSTDRIWWEELVAWLLSNVHRKLVIFWKGNEAELDRRIPTKYILLKKEIMDNFLKEGKGNYSEKDLKSIQQRIIIMFNSDIFSFPHIE